MSFPRITIVTPSFNQAPYLEDTIRSVLDQNYPNLEYIIVDGGSTDGSVEIIKKYADRLAWWVSEPDRGQSHAINKGLARSTGEVENWINSDDMLVPGALHEVGRRFADDPRLGILVGQRVRMDQQGALLSLEDYRLNHMHWDMHAFRYYPSQECAFWRSDRRRYIGDLREDLHYSMDYDWYLRLSAASKARVTECYLAAFRIYPGQKGDLRDGNGEDMERVYGEYFATNCRPGLAWKAAIRAYRRLTYNRFAFRFQRVYRHSVMPLPEGTTLDDIGAGYVRAMPGNPIATVCRTPSNVLSNGRHAESILPAEFQNAELEQGRRA